MIAVINRSSLADTDVSFYANGCDLQMRNHFCPAWQGVSYEPVEFFANEKDLPVASGIAKLMIIQDTIDDANALGYHTFVGVPYGIVLAQAGRTSVTLSHECLEMAADATASKWSPWSEAGKLVALEVCDPVESNAYEISVVIMGVTRPIMVSNFILPSWFQPAGREPYDFLDVLKSPLSLASGGYVVTQDKNGGNVSDIWGEHFGAEDMHTDSMVRFYQRLATSTSRIRQRGMRA